MRRSESPIAIRLVLGVIAIVGVIALWRWASTDAPPSVPTPKDVWSAASDLLNSGTLVGALLTSLGRVAVGFLIAFALGATLGILMARSRVVFEALDPIIESVRPIAPVALVPLAILWLGTGPESAVGVIAYSAFFPVVLNAHAAVKDMGDSLINAAKTFGVNQAAITTQVVLPGTIPGLMVGARLGIGLAWASVIAAELAVGNGVSSTLGIGQLMFQYYQFEANPNPIVVCMIAVGLTGLLLDALVRQIGRLLMPWRGDRSENTGRRARKKLDRSME